MKKLTILTLTLVTMLVLPVVASATHFEGLDGSADCAGWSATVDVRFGNLTFEGTLHIVVVLTNEAGDILNQFDITEPISREPGSSTGQTYMFDGEWEGTHYGQIFTMSQVVELSVPNGDADEIAFEQSFECTVDNEATNWGAVKSIYR